MAVKYIRKWNAETKEWVNVGVTDTKLDTTRINSGVLKKLRYWNDERKYWVDIHMRDNKLVTT